MTLVRTPLIVGEVNLSSGDQLHWKQVLPLDYKLDYNGHSLHFDKKYINEVIRAYKENALGDPVAFQLADDENQHDTKEDITKLRNHDPERFRGTVKAMELRESETDAGRNGLWCGFSLTDAGKKLVKNNQELGVSASLSQGFDPQYPVIMRHVVGTIHPKIKRMAGWEQALVSLSDVENEKEEVLSFMPQEESNKKEENGKIEVDKTEWDAIKQYVADKQKEDEELDKFLKEAAEEPENAPANTPAPVNLSEDPVFKQMQMDLAESKANAASEKWQRERADYARQGVPKAMLDLAEPIMQTATSMTVNLSEGKDADGKEAMRKMLNEAKGFIDLSEEEGFGHANTNKREEDKTEEDKRLDAIYEDFTMNGAFD